MVCPRCIAAVEGLLAEFGIQFHHVGLGVVELFEKLKKPEEETLRSELLKRGFELLEPGKQVLISKIKSLIIEKIHKENDTLNTNFSTWLADQLHYDYSYLSRLFSSVEGITIEKYIKRQKIEKIKELLFYGENTLAEIADRMNYSSVAYLSAQFKKETGMTPSQFKSQKDHRRKPLNEI